MPPEGTNCYSSILRGLEVRYLECILLRPSGVNADTYPCSVLIFFYIECSSSSWQNNRVSSHLDYGEHQLSAIVCFSNIPIDMETPLICF